MDNDVVVKLVLGAFAALAAPTAGVHFYRNFSATRNVVASGNRQSTFEEGVHKKLAELEAENIELRDLVMRLTSALKGVQRVLEIYRVFEGQPPPQARQMLHEAQESAFAVLDELPKPRKD